MKIVARIFLTIFDRHFEFIKILRENGLSTLLLETFNEYLPNIHEMTKQQFPSPLSADILPYTLAYNAGGM